MTNKYLTEKSTASYERIVYCHVPGLAGITPGCMRRRLRCCTRGWGCVPHTERNVRCANGQANELPVACDADIIKLILGPCARRTQCGLKTFHLGANVCQNQPTRRAWDTLLELLICTGIATHGASSVNPSHAVSAFDANRAASCMFAYDSHQSGCGADSPDYAELARIS